MAERVVNPDAPGFPQRRDIVILTERLLPYVLDHWRPIADGLGWFGDVDYDDEETAVRPHTGSARILSMLFAAEEYDPAATGVSRDRLLELSEAALRTASLMHKANFDQAPAPLKKINSPHLPWGKHWQSTLWTYFAIRAAMILGGELTAETRELLGSVVEFEADRFLDMDPPSGMFYDTKAEENAWDALFLAWAPAFLPQHSRAAQWEHRAKVFAINSYPRADDRLDRTWLEDRPVGDWLEATCVLPDYTVENHGAFHPGYQGCSALLLQGALAFEARGMPVPRHFLFNVREAFERVIPLLLPSGRTVYPASNDWLQYDALNYAHYAHFLRDGRALWAFRKDMQIVVRLLEVSPNSAVNGVFLTGSDNNTFWFEIDRGQTFPDAYEVLPIDGVDEVNPYDEIPETVHPYKYAELVIARSREAFRSFSWRSLQHQPLGVYMPKGADSFGAWAAGSFVGRVAIKHGGKVVELAPRPRTHREIILSNGFVTFGFADLCLPDEDVGVARQYLLFAALPDGQSVVFAEHIVAINDVEVTENVGLTYKLENDAMNGCVRRVRVLDGEVVEAAGYGGGEGKMIPAGQGIVIEDVLAAACSCSLGYHAPAERLDFWKSICYDELIVPGKPGRYSAGDRIREFAAAMAPGDEVDAPSITTEECVLVTSGTDRDGRPYILRAQLEPDYFIECG